MENKKMNFYDLTEKVGKDTRVIIFDDGIFMCYFDNRIFKFGTRKFKQYNFRQYLCKIGKTKFANHIHKGTFMQLECPNECKVMANIVFPVLQEELKKEIEKPIQSDTGKLGYKVKEGDLQGDIEDFPVQIVQRMVDCQVEQGNMADVTIFQKNKSANCILNGFYWHKTKEGYDFWLSVICGGNDRIFFEKYPLPDEFSCLLEEVRQNQSEYR